MIWQIGMPNLGHTMEEGKVVEWLKKIGDPVRKGEAIVVVESDKANFEVESPGDGVLVAANAESGAIVQIGGVIGVVADAGEAITSPESSPSKPIQPEGAGSWQIGMPNLGHTMEEGKVVEWLKKVGDPVSKGEPVVVVESDKANFDVESPGDGVLLAAYADSGAVVPVGRVIGVIGVPGESVISPDVVCGQPTVAPPGVAAFDATAPESPRSARLKISPAARALARDLGVSPENIVGSGIDGMISRDDVRRHAEKKSGSEAKERARKPLSRMRQAIAKATTHSWQAAPHVALHSHAEVSWLGEGAANLTATIARACAMALIDHPAFNGQLVGSSFEQSPHADLGFAVSTSEGLVTVVVSKSETKSAKAIGDELKILAAKARGGQLDGAEMLGASFTISSLGRWGVDAFTPIIVVPQVGILGVGRPNRVAREGPGGTVRFASELALTLVFDHRANDGMEAAKFLASIVENLENSKRLEIPNGH
jgi:pyruvate dehydrogenase E2 component (dihydrolipoamide acetyltransferase)